MLHGNVQRKTGRGGMGEHNQPDTENSQKFDMQQLFLFTRRRGDSGVRQSGALYGGVTMICMIVHENI